jgi:hypothetical protein
MKFDPVIHTKEFIASNVEVAFELAISSAEFVKSDLANDLDVLKLSDEFGQTVAHKLAENQSELWINSVASKSFEILKWVTHSGWSVAHWLAIKQPKWVHSEAAQHEEILRLSSETGQSVAHMLAQNQPEWIKSSAAKNPEILALNSDYGSVAKYLVEKSKACIHHEPLMRKQILTLECKGHLLAERIAEKYGSEGFGVPFIAMKLINQGAAYKHSEPFEYEIGEAILSQCKILMADNVDNLVNLKQLQALYSTIFHNVSKMLVTQTKNSLEIWQGLLWQSESLIRQHLKTNTHLFDVEHTVDIFCEPADSLMRKLKSERVLISDLAVLDDFSSGIDKNISATTRNIY